MQKTLEFLEQNVQWLALAIAAVFFGLCVWWYVVTPPAQIVSPKLSKEPLTPQNVDDAIHAGPVQDIKRQLEGPQQELAINVPDVVKPWQKQMNAENAPVLVLTYPRPLFPPGQIVGPTGPTEILVGGTVKEMPILPKAAPQTPQSGMSVVSNPAPAQGGGGAQAAAAINNDKEWATVSGVIPANDVKAAFLKVQNELNQKLQAKGMPNIQLTTDILKIELQRQRGSVGQNGPLFPNGENGVETVPLPQYLQNMVQPLPDAKAGLAEKVNYYDWAEKNAELVTQPKF